MIREEARETFTTELTRTLLLTHSIHQFLETNRDHRRHRKIVENIQEIKLLENLEESLVTQRLLIVLILRSILKEFFYPYFFIDNSEEIFNINIFFTFLTKISLLYAKH